MKEAGLQSFSLTRWKPKSNEARNPLMVQMRPNAWAVEEFFLISTQAVENDLFNVNFVGKMKSMRQIDVNLCRVCVLAEKASENVLFIHGFISSSAFWTETVFPNLSEATKSKYRLIAIDLLGFGRSPKPTDSLYTLREHVDMIERSVLEPFKMQSFHIVAHSLGCILALALAVKYPDAIKSLTLLAPVRSSSF